MDLVTYSQIFYMLVLTSNLANISM